MCGYLEKDAVIHLYIDKSIGYNITSLSLAGNGKTLQIPRESRQENKVLPNQAEIFKDRGTLSSSVATELLRPVYSSVKSSYQLDKIEYFCNFGPAWPTAVLFV